MGAVKDRDDSLSNWYLARLLARNPTSWSRPATRGPWRCAAVKFQRTLVRFAISLAHPVDYLAFRRLSSSYQQAHALSRLKTWSLCPLHSPTISSRPSQHFATRLFPSTPQDSFLTSDSLTTRLAMLPPCKLLGAIVWQKHTFDHSFSS